MSTGPLVPSQVWRRSAVLISRFVLGGALTVGILGITSGLWLRPLEPETERLTQVLSQTIETGGVEAAEAQYRGLRRRSFEGVHESESDMNGLGYALLRKGEIEGAIRIFELNAETYPESSNVWDSLAEAHLAAGRQDLAIVNYEKAVAIDPGMKSAASALEKLTGAKRKSYRPIVLFHICAGIVGLLSGVVAMLMDKGSRAHGASGNVFFISMLSMSASGAYVAFTDPHGEVINVLMGVLTFYMVSTAWLTARRRNGGTGPRRPDRPSRRAGGRGTGLVTSALEAASQPVENERRARRRAVLLLRWRGAAGRRVDLRMIARGGVFGAQRIARHLWRMCGALFIAVTSLFLGQPQVFPRCAAQQRCTVGAERPGRHLLIFWLIRVRFPSRRRSAVVVNPIEAYMTD